MLKLISTKRISFDKTTFTISLQENEIGSKYISIGQEIAGKHSMDTIHMTIDMFESILSELSTLVNNQKLKRNTNINPLKSAELQAEIIRLYFKGIPLENLTLQFNCSLETLKNVLYMNNIEIVNNNTPPRKRWFRRKKY